MTLPLFNLAATPEPEAHGAFLDVLARGAGTGHPLIALIDESGFLARWPDDDSRVAARRDAWRDFVAQHGAVAVFVDLAAPDLAAAEADLVAASALDAGEPPRGRVP